MSTNLDLHSPEVVVGQVQDADGVEDLRLAGEVQVHPEGASVVGLKYPRLEHMISTLLHELILLYSNSFH